MHPAIIARMKVVQEYGRICMVYASFVVFLGAEVTAVYYLYKYLGVL